MSFTVKQAFKCFRERKRAEYNKYEYSKPYCRIQPYLVGFIIGYVIYRKYRNPFKQHGWVSS